MSPLFQYEVIKGVRIYEVDERIAEEFEEGVMKRLKTWSSKKGFWDREIMEAIENGYFEFEYRANPWTSEIHETAYQELKLFDDEREESYRIEGSTLCGELSTKKLEVVFWYWKIYPLKTYGFKENWISAIAKTWERQMITFELSDELSKMAGYRNRMVHFLKGYPGKSFMKVSMIEGFR